ncbi:hypothetical protein HPB48_008094 [Haemaphysalis longicornis]|uniref:Uncharacterized protein n=1 Tax=Haemaphysalis longicornis TaxID=44386 RepID=A0A9J6GLQ9_HAELO|nr:hypothetical protein HPB48_008094 [Haemaphysalis longicornis]
MHKELVQELNRGREADQQDRDEFRRFNELHFRMLTSLFQAVFPDQTAPLTTTLMSMQAYDLAGKQGNTHTMERPTRHVEHEDESQPAGPAMETVEASAVRTLSELTERLRHDSIPVLLLQETHCLSVHLTGYNTYSCPTVLKLIRGRRSKDKQSPAPEARGQAAVLVDMDACPQTCVRDEGPLVV